MVVFENAFVYMVGDSWDEWVMEFWYAEPEIRWVTFGMQSIEQTEEFAIAYATDVTNVHGSWLPYGMPEIGVCDRKLFTIDVAVGGHWRLEGTWYQRRGEGLYVRKRHSLRRQLQQSQVVARDYHFFESILFGNPLR
jgi:hypothetical protein